jgi:hypothetical protein
MHHSVSSRLVRSLVPFALLLTLIFSTRAQAQAADPASNQDSNQDHIVSSQALQQQVTSSAQTRQKNIETLTELLKTPTAQKAMHDAKVDPVQVKYGIPTLSDDELANLSGRVTKAQSDFSAGILGIGLFTIIILVVILIIIVAVIH